MDANGLRVWSFMRAADFGCGTHGGRKNDFIGSFRA